MTTKKTDVSAQLSGLVKQIENAQKNLQPQIDKVFDEVKIMNTPLKTKDIDFEGIKAVMTIHSNNKVVVTFHDNATTTKYFSRPPVITIDEFISNGSEMKLSGMEFGYKKCNQEWLNKPWYKRLFTTWQ